MVEYYKILAGMLLLYAAWVDWRTFRIPYVSILGVACLGLAFRNDVGDPWTEVLLLPLLTGLLLLTVFWLLEKYLNKPVLGYGDIQLIVASLFWVRLERLPFFLIFVGTIVIATELWHIRFRLKRPEYLPAAHAIGLAWFLLLWL